MKKYLLITLFLTSFLGLKAQTIYKELRSTNLGETRKLKIQLPRNYKKNTHLTYPVIVVLDADYLFEPVAGNVDYYSYWEDMPESIVVGVMQYGKKEKDFFLDEETGFPDKSGGAFFEFLGYELFQYLNETFRTSNFRAIVGHGESANFMNFYLFKNDPVFHAYIGFSPKLTDNVIENLKPRLESFDSKRFYYLASGTNDKKRIMENVQILQEQLNTIDNDFIQYKGSMFEEGTYYTSVTNGISHSLENIFAPFKPISKKEYKEVILKLDDKTAVDYLVEKYQAIENLYNLKKQIRINDFKAVEAALKKNDEFHLFQDLAKMAQDEYPGTVLHAYYQGMYEMEYGEPKKALRLYQNAYTQENIAGLDKDFFIDKVKELKADFGW